jgi:hypothetical protein
LEREIGGDVERCVCSIVVTPQHDKRCLCLPAGKITSFSNGVVEVAEPVNKPCGQGFVAGHHATVEE